MEKDVEKKYVENGGVRCPFCGDNDIETIGDVKTDIGIAWQDVVCNNCDKKWQDQYNLVGANEVTR